MVRGGGEEGGDERGKRVRGVLKRRKGRKG